MSVLALLVILETASRTGMVSATSFPPISDDFRALFSQLGDPAYWTSVAHTMEGWGIGLGIASLLAIPLGITIGVSPLLYRSVRVIVEFLRPIPSVAMIPLAVLVFGVGLKSKVFLAAFAAFWPLFVQVLYGVQDVDPVATDTGRSFGLGRLVRLRSITLPSTAPYIATGLRLSSAVALILAVIAELVIGSPGLGRDINAAQAGGAFDLMYALIITTGLLGLSLNTIFTFGERRVLHWHSSQRVGGERR